LKNSAALEALIDEVLAPPPARGRKARPLEISFRRELNEGDVQALWDVPEGGLESTVRPLVKLRYQHHYLARLLAEGRPNEECALCTGYDPARISVLKSDPAFSELITYYKTQVQEVYINVHERLAALGLNSVEELMDRLDVQPEKFTNRELMELGALGLDRAGFGPQSKVHHTTGPVLTADVMARLKDELAKRSLGQVRTLTQGSGRAPDGGPIIEGTLATESEAEGSEGQGSDL
jgi:hypothetical protein